jgi:hypothetical protein
MDDFDVVGRITTVDPGDFPSTVFCAGVNYQ